jgi:hypothetical protein
VQSQRLGLGRRPKARTGSLHTPHIPTSGQCWRHEAHKVEEVVRCGRAQVPFLSWSQREEGGWRPWPGQGCGLARLLTRRGRGECWRAPFMGFVCRVAQTHCHLESCQGRRTAIGDSCLATGCADVALLCSAHIVRPILRTHLRSNE